MIHVEAAPEPPTFDERVRRPGMLAVAELAGEVPDPPRAAGRAFEQVAASRDEIPAKKLPTYWRRCLDELLTAYKRICAYCCFSIHEVTGAHSVDHMAPKSQRWDQAYEWTNYRLASALLNSRKNDFGDVLDPFEVEDGWFVLELVGFQVEPAPGLSAECRKQVEDTIDRLGLNEHLFRRRRETDAIAYWDKEISFAHLMKESPFVARELERQGKRRAGPDVAEP